MISGRNRFPFTATQWQELEHQALIFKYMVSGTPIPPDLLFTIRRSLDSSLSSKLILHQPQHIGWNCFQMGFGRKIDPEPGRCRRTDGKKWRCSKEAYPDSKYCERHMHRGRNRSRKPVEAMTSTTTATSNNSSKTSPPTAIPISSITKNPNPSLSNSLSSSMVSDTGYSTSHLHHHFLYPHSSSSRPPGVDLSSKENTTNLLLDSSLCSHPDKDYRYGYGMKEEADEHPFYSESSGSVRSYSGSSVDDPWQLTPLTMGLKQRTSSGFQSEYPFLQLEGLAGNSRQQNQDQRFHVTGSDFKYDMHLKLEREEKPQKVMHHFFDERPKNREPWLDSEGKSSSHYGPVSTTQLSISMPNSSHDFFASRSGD